MQRVKIVIVLFLMALSFFSGLQYKNVFDNTIKTGSLTIDQEIHDWAVTSAEEDKPVRIQLYVRNITSSDISGDAKFKVTIKPIGVETSFITGLIELAGEDEIIKNERHSDKKFIAISNYIKRGKELPGGQEYEIIENPDKENYEVYMTTNVEIKSGETKKYSLEVMIPPGWRGYVLSVTQ